MTVLSLFWNIKEKSKLLNFNEIVDTVRYSQNLKKYLALPYLKWKNQLKSFYLG